MSADSASDVSGPVATITGSRSLDVGNRASTSSRTIVMSGCVGERVGDVSANRSRSTASAAPAGTRLASAARMTSEPSRRISSFEQADGVIELVAAEGVAADELGEAVGLVDGGRPHRPHLVQRDRHAARGGLPGGLAIRRARRR